MFKKQNDYYIEVTDDGQGIDFESVKKKARKLSMINNNEKDITNASLLNFLFTPHFTLRDKKTDTSGDGIGLSIVKKMISQMKGHISICTKKDKGTKISLKIPSIKKVSEYEKRKEYLKN